MGRGTVSRELFAVVSRRYGIASIDGHRELEESFNLNVMLRSGERRLVLRIYRPTTTPSRLDALQRTRRFLLDGGLPFAPLLPALDGSGWVEFGGRMVEVEEYVLSETYMESFEQILLAMPMLARIHNRLRLAPVDEAAATAPVANHLAAGRTVDAVAAGLGVAHALSRRLQLAEAPHMGRLPSQLVHGDFWDDNVRFTGSRISLVTDLDFMGYRPRVDDLALTLFYTNERLGRDDVSAQRRAQLRTLVDAYDEVLEPRLSALERRALPYAIARTPLCFAAQVASDPGLASSVVANRGPAWSWALGVIDDPDWTTAFS